MNLPRHSSRIALLLAALALLGLPLFAAGTYFTHVAISVFIFAIAAIGLNLLTGYTGQLSLSHAAFMAIGAYVAALISKNLAHHFFFAATGLHLWLGLAAGTLGAGLVGALLAIPALRARGPYLAMTTIAFGWIIWKILVEAVPVTGGDLGISSIPRLQIGRWELSEAGVYFVALGFLLLVAGLQHHLIAGPYGLAMRAVKECEWGLLSTGVSADRVKLSAFVVSSAIAGLAGTLFAFQQLYINPDSFQIFDSIFILLLLLFGGVGTEAGPVVGAALLILLPEFLHEFERYRLIIYGGILLLSLYFMPRGVVGSWLRRRATKGRASSPASSVDSSVAPAAEEAEVSLPASPGGRLVVENVAHFFGGIKALKGVSLTVERGTIHALIGSNGAGKTTLINIISGFYTPDAGHILLDGRPTSSRSLDAAAREGIVRTFQSTNVLGDLTAIEHVMLGFFVRDRVTLWKCLRTSRKSLESRWQHRRRAQRLLELVGASQWADTPVRDISHGHRRLVEIARTVATQPRLLLLDEPTAGLGAGEAGEVARTLQKLRASGMTILLVEHNMDFVRRISDHITVLDQGLVIADGEPEGILEDARVTAAYLGTPDGFIGTT